MIIGLIFWCGWVLFGVMGVIWGVFYLFIKVVVKYLLLLVVVFGCMLVLLVVFVVLVVWVGVLRLVLARWWLVLVFAAMEMVVLWLLFIMVEKWLFFGIIGFLIVCVLFVGVVVVYVLGDWLVLWLMCFVGIGLGMGGVALLVGHDLGAAGGVPWASVAAVLVVCVGYATALFLVVCCLVDVFVGWF